MNATFPGSRDVALLRLASFVQGGPKYGVARNYVDDSCSTVSRLSPYIRRRALLEEEILGQLLAAHPFSAVEKFVQEVVWRNYWKGWIEGRPWVWNRYLDELDAYERDDSTAGLMPLDRKLLARALVGETSLDYFNAWAKELVATGYLHNHVRMWFASIWIFTLGLPWQLGAKFFLEHLLDGDPAVNTLSWRWVAGLQTVGKHYVATASNIRRYTEGRWAPHANELCAAPTPLRETPFESNTPLTFHPITRTSLPTRTRTLLIHEEDLHPLSGELLASDCETVLALAPSFEWRAHRASEQVKHFVTSLFDDAIERIERELSVRVTRVCDADQISAATTTEEIICFKPLVGFIHETLTNMRPALTQRGISLSFIDRAHDARCFPYAKRGFFPYWEQLSKTMRR